MPGNNIIYNVTVKVDKSIAGAWLKWMITEQAPKIIATKCFTNFTMLKLLEHDDEESNTYAIQFCSNTIEDYQRYLNLFARNFSKESFDKWGERFIVFSTIMQVIK